MLVQSLNKLGNTCCGGNILTAKLQMESISDRTRGKNVLPCLTGSRVGGTSFLKLVRNLVVATTVWPEEAPFF